FVRPLLGSGGERLIKRLKRLQDVLGELNDAAVAHKQVQALQAAGLDGPGARAYLAHQEEVIQAQRQGFQAVWRAFLARKNRRRLAQALAEM
ncbi:MAG: CHAD domain-containing protein, partial [Caldilineae bacterium]